MFSVIYIYSQIHTHTGSVYLFSISTVTTGYVSCLKTKSLAITESGFYSFLLPNQQCQKH